jgi:PAT family beta-lactamase induction signal transducer AmpG
VYWVTALFMLPGVALTLAAAEPRLQRPGPRTLAEAVIEPFQEFIRRGGWNEALLVLLFIFLYKLGDSMATALATPFYLDIGFTKSEIGIIAKNAGLWASVAGGMLGGLWMVRIGINRGLWLFGVVQMVSILGFAWLAWENRPDKALLAGVIAFEALGVGLGTAAFVAYIARATDPRYTATQYALFTSLAAVPRTVINAATGWIVEQTGWFAFFLLCTALALPGMALLLRVAPWNERGKDEHGRDRP